MRTVYKYPLSPPFIIGMPASAKVIHVATQQNMPCLWVELDDKLPSVPRHFSVVGTGHKIPEGAIHVGTVKLEQDTIILHVYEDYR